MLDTSVLPRQAQALQRVFGYMTERHPAPLGEPHDCRRSALSAGGECRAPADRGTEVLEGDGNGALSGPGPG